MDIGRFRVGFASGSTVRRFTPLLIVAALLGVLPAARAAVPPTYTWNQTGSASWASSTNWTPARTTPATTDILVFNNGATTTVTAVPAQTIGQLQVSGNTNVTLQAAVTATTLTLGGGAGSLAVGSGSALNISGTNTLTISIPAGSTGSVSGSMTFINGAHKLTASSASGITFQNGSVFTAGTGFSSNAFGTTGTANSVVFGSGSKYIHLAGSNPFALTAPAAITVFQTGSLFSQQTATGASFAGRTFGDYEWKNGTNSATGTTAFVMDNLTVTSGTLNLNLTGVPGYAVKGAISVATGATLGFNPASATTLDLKGNISVATGGALGFNPAVGSVINLSGASAQTISNAGTITFGANETINVANASGVFLGNSITLNGPLTLTTGTVSTGANTLSIASAATVTRGTGYVIGNLKKTFTAAGSKSFEVGTANGYSPVTANVTAGAPADLTVVAVQSPQPSMNSVTSLQRYWTMTASAPVTADLTFEYLAGDVFGNEASYKVYRVSGGVPVAFGSSVVNTGAHLATLAGVSSFADFTVGEADTTPPVVTSVNVPADGTYTSGQALDFTVNLSEATLVNTGGGTPRIPITLNSGGTVYASYVSGSGSLALLFRYTVANGDADPDGITVGAALDPNGGSLQDAAGNNATTTLNNVGATTGVLVDALDPTVASIVRANPSPTNAATVDFTVTFSEGVANVSSAAFTLTQTGSAAGTISNVVAVDAKTYTVTVNPASGEGTLRLDVNASGTGITDIAGNALNGGFTTGEVYTLDHLGPVVTSVAVPANSTYTTGQNLDFTVNLNEPAIVAGGTPRLTVTLNSGTVYANYVSGSGTSALLFRYTVVTGNTDPDGIVLGGNIDLNGASVRDFIGNNANPALNGVGSTAGILVDANSPVVVSVTRVGPVTTNAVSVDFTVTFSQSVSGVDASDFSISTTGAVLPSGITNVAGSGIVYTVTVGTGTGDGTMRLDVLADGTIVSTTNSAVLAAPFNSGDVITIDKTAPVVSSIARVGTATTNAASVQFTVTFGEGVTGVTASTFALASSGLSGAAITTVTGSGTTWTVTAGTGSGDGTLGLNAVADPAVTDLAGNALTSPFTGAIYTVDKTAPAVSSVVLADTDPSSALTVHYTVTFAEAVTGVDAGDFALTATGVTGSSVTGVTGSGTTYTVTASTGTGNGTLRLDVISNGTILDPAGNTTSGSYTAGLAYTMRGTPAAPAGLTATAGNNQASLAWVASSGATSYSVLRGTTPGGPYTSIGSPVSNSFPDSTAANGTTYYYVVKATGARGTSANSTEASATPLAPAATPSGLTPTAGSNHVALAWSVSSGATTYNVKRATVTGGPYTTIGSPATNSFDDLTAANGTAYFYVVSALNAAGESSNSAEVTATPNAAVTPGVIVLSQVYGGGGNAGSTLKNDFIELFNRGGSPVNVAGWSVQYVSAAGTAWAATPLTGTINPGQYFLVQEAVGTAGTTNLPTPDVIGTIPMGATAGKVALVNNTTAFAVGCPAAGAYVDLIGYGPTATCSETTPTSALTNTTAAIRKNAGCTDSNNNFSDFTVSGLAAPRNSATALNLCATGGPNNPPTITAPANPIATVTSGITPFTVGLTGSDDGGTFIWSATAGTGVATVTVTGGQTTASVTYTVTLQAGFTGVATFTATLSDNVNPNVNQAVNIQVNASGVNNPPAINAPANPAATVTQDSAPFPVTVSGIDDGGVYNWTATPGAGVANVVVSGGQATSTATYTVTLNAGFTGTAAFTATLSDNVNPNVNQVVNILVTVPPPPASHVVISQLYGGGGNSGAPYTNDYVELYNPTSSLVSLSGWSIQYGAATSTTTFTNITPIGGVIGPGEYYLIGLAGGAVGSPLPTANATGSINMSGTAGKIALVSSGTPLSGICSTMLADPTLVDFVGYGTTASCSEGGSPAPAPSNTTALFRKAGGNTDTNNNANDFVTGTPNPRRTAVIGEIGPSIVNTDPAANGVNAPRDASITINFSEPVHYDLGWYNISCATTGPHNDATIGGGPSTWIITPNQNFLAGELCTVTILGDHIHDDDLDDSAPGTDTLASDRTWTFTVSTGTAPVYPPTVHLTMGNPSGAVSDITVPLNYLMMKPEYAESYNRDKGTPNWVSWHLSDEWVGTLTRVDSFRPDPAVPPAWYRVLHTDYSFSGFDRGHMTPNADRDKETSIPINQATFLMANMVPQAPDNNQGPWANLENFLRTLVTSGDELYIVSGPAGVGGTGSNGGLTTTIANGHVTVPASTWKCALILVKASGDDVARVTPSTQTLCVIMPNIQGIRNVDWHTYLTTVDAVEALTGYDLFSNVPPAIQGVIEARIYGSTAPLPPGTGGQNATTREDTPKTITLDAISPSGAPLTYTIVTNPSNGALMGAGANWTYTPSLNFNGNDSFTFNVSDGTSTSNTSTVSLAVLEVNDPPTAVNDSKTASQNAALTFPAADLTLNDSKGPANESSQTLTVTTVTPTANTHGTVSLNAGQITYTPAFGFSGASSFTYQMCDNGFTAGLSDPLCSSATVNVNVQLVAPSPTASIPSQMDGCLETHLSIPVTLTGTGPWTLVWSDGLTQSGITSTPAVRDYWVAGPATLSITSVRDAFGLGGASNSMDITVNTLIIITTQPDNQLVTNGATATFSIAASGSNLHYQWFYDDRRTTPRPVGSDSPTYLTGPITDTSHYYVRVFNGCAMVDSRFVVAAVRARTRAVNH